MELFPESDSKFRSKLSQRNIAGAITSKLFAENGNVCEDLIQPSATSACEILIRLIMSGEAQYPSRCKYYIGSYYSVRQCSSTANEVCLKSSFLLKIAKNKSSLKEINKRLVESDARLLRIFSGYNISVKVENNLGWSSRNFAKFINGWWTGRA